MITHVHDKFGASYKSFSEASKLVNNARTRTRIKKEDLINMLYKNGIRSRDLRYLMFTMLLGFCCNHDKIGDQWIELHGSNVLIVKK